MDYRNAKCKTRRTVKQQAATMLCENKEVNNNSSRNKLDLDTNKLGRLTLVLMPNGGTLLKSQVKK